MPSGWVRSDFVEWAVVLTGTWFVLRRSTSDRWQRRLGAIRSPLLGSPTYRMLFLLVAIGLLLIAVLPEAAFVLPAVDAVGLDIVTIFAALELRHYVSAVARRVDIPSSLADYLGVWSVTVIRCKAFLRAKPMQWLYASMWPMIWLRTHVH